MLMLAKEANAALDPAGRHAVLESEFCSEHPDRSETTPDSSAQMCAPLVWRSHHTPPTTTENLLEERSVDGLLIGYPPLS